MQSPRRVPGATSCRLLPVAREPMLQSHADHPRRPALLAACALQHGRKSDRPTGGVARAGIGGTVVGRQRRHERHVRTQGAAEDAPQRRPSLRWPGRQSSTRLGRGSRVRRMRGVHQVWDWRGIATEGETSGGMCRPSCHQRGHPHQRCHCSASCCCEMDSVRRSLALHGAALLGGWHQFAVILEACMGGLIPRLRTSARYCEFCRDCSAPVLALLRKQFVPCLHLLYSESACPRRAFFPARRWKPLFSDLDLHAHMHARVHALNRFRPSVHAYEELLRVGTQCTSENDFGCSSHGKI